MTQDQFASGRPGRIGRRRLFYLAGSLGLIAALPSPVWPAEGNYEAMLLSCIDPRMVEPIHNYMDQRGLRGRYSQFVFAGAAIGVVAPAFKAWESAFWDNLATSMRLHHIKTIIALDHRDCGAAKIAYGEENVANRQVETVTHRKALTEFRRQVGLRQPDLAVETGLMALDGSVEMFA